MRPVVVLRQGGGFDAIVAVIELYSEVSGKFKAGGDIFPFLDDLDRVDAGLLHLIFGQEVELNFAVRQVTAALKIVNLQRVIAGCKLIGLGRVHHFAAVGIIEGFYQTSGEVDGAFDGGMYAADIQHDFIVDQNPHIVIAVEAKDHIGGRAVSIGDLIAHGLAILDNAAVVGQPEVHFGVQTEPVVGVAVIFGQSESLIRLSVQGEEVVVI